MVFMIKKMKIPAKRVNVLIGKHGKDKIEIEKLTKTKIDINDEITITGEAIDLMTAENMTAANAATVRAQDEMLGTLLDMKI